MNESQDRKLSDIMPPSVFQSSNNLECITLIYNTLYFELGAKPNWERWLRQ